MAAICCVAIQLSVLLHVTYEYYMLLYVHTICYYIYIIYIHVTAIQLYAIHYTAICYYTNIIQCRYRAKFGLNPGHEAPAEWPMLHWALGSPPWKQNMDIVQCAISILLQLWHWQILTVQWCSKTHVKHLYVSSGIASQRIYGKQALWHDVARQEKDGHVQQMGFQWLQQSSQVTAFSQVFPDFQGLLHLRNSLDLTNLKLAPEIHGNPGTCHGKNCAMDQWTFGHPANIYNSQQRLGFLMEPKGP